MALNITLPKGSWQAVFRFKTAAVRPDVKLGLAVTANRGSLKLAQNPLSARELRAGNGRDGVGSWRGVALGLDNAALLWLAKLGIFLPGLSAWALCEKLR
jgi:hypothetical protein